MSECLVTKLKSAVDNDNLQYLNALTIVVNTTSAYFNMNLSFYTTAKIISDSDDVYFTDSTYAKNYGKTIVQSEIGSYDIYATPGTYKIIAYSKYGIRSVSKTLTNIENGVMAYYIDGDTANYLGSNVDGNINLMGENLFNHYKFLSTLDLTRVRVLQINFEYRSSQQISDVVDWNLISQLTNIDSIKLYRLCNYDNTVFDFNDVLTWNSGMTNLILDHIYLENPDITKLGTRFTSLNTLQITGLNTYAPFSGQSFESFVQAQRAAGRTTCTGMYVPWLGSSGITFNGATLTSQYANCNLSWTETTITLDEDGTTTTVTA